MADLQIVPFAANGGNIAGLGVFGAQQGDRINKVIGTVTHTDPFTSYVIVKLLPEEDCVIRIGVDAVAGAETGDPLKAGIEVARFIREGERISVIAP